MIPGTAVGVLVGDLIFTAMAFRLARRTGRTDVTAMPLGLDTPSTFGSVFLIIGPAFLAATGEGPRPGVGRRRARLVPGHRDAPGVGRLQAGLRAVERLGPPAGPRAGLLGSLTAIALVMISFLPLLDIAGHPVAGFVSLIVVLATLTARWRLPGKIPGSARRRGRSAAWSTTG